MVFNDEPDYEIYIHYGGQWLRIRIYKRHQVVQVANFNIPLHWVHRTRLFGFSHVIHL